MGFNLGFKGLILLTNIKEDELGWEYGTYGREDKCIRGFCGGNLKERHQF